MRKFKVGDAVKWAGIVTRREDDLGLVQVMPDKGNEYREKQVMFVEELTLVRPAPKRKGGKR